MTRRPASDLEGDLARFPPALLFQMMGLGQLHGMLRLQQRREVCTVYFQGGKLVFAQGPRPQERLGEELVRRGLLERRACDEAMRDSRRSGQRLGSVLVAGGALSRPQLEELVRARIKDTIYEVLEWREGRFRFESGVQPESEDILLDVGLDSLLLECMARQDDARRTRDERGERRA